MSLTGCPPAGAASPSQLAAERTELLALLWQMLDGASAYCANPRVLMVSRLVPELEAAPAFGQLRELRQTASRDQLIKGIVCAAHRLPVPAEIAGLAAALDALSDANYDTSRFEARTVRPPLGTAPSKTTPGPKKDPMGIR